MKLYGSLSRLVSILFRKDSQDITVRPNQATTYTAARDVQLPPGDAAHVLVSADSTQTLTGKTIDGDNNTVQDLALTSLKTEAGDADKVIRRNGSGVVISGNSIPNNSALVTTDSTSTLTNKTFDADGTGNSLTNIDDGNIKSGAAINATKIHDGSVDNTEFGFLNGVTSSIQGQFNSDKWKQPVRVASTGNVVIASELENGDTLDGVTLATGDRVLLKDQSTGSQNGIYVVVASGAASRSVDADASAEFPAMYVQVQEGTANADTLWYVTNNNDFVLGTDTPTYARFRSASADAVTGPASSTDNALARFDGTTGKIIQNSAGILSDAGALSGLTQLDVDNLRADGNTLSSTDTNGNVILDPNGSGEVQIGSNLDVRAAASLKLSDSDSSAFIGHKAPATVSSSITYTWPEAPAANNYVLKSQTDGTLSWSASALSSFAADWITADGTTKAITHNLGTKDIQVEIYDKTDDSTLLVDSIVRTSTSVVTLTSSEAPGAAGWRVTIHAI